MNNRINLPEHELAEIKKLTHLDDDLEAVVRAAREYVRLIRIKELQAASGKIDFDLNWLKEQGVEVDPVPQ